MKQGLKDSKSALQELAQGEYKLTPVYQVIDESGPEHEKTFRVGVYFGDKLKGEGTGLSKQDAEQDAAKNLLEKLSGKK